MRHLYLGSCSFHPTINLDLRSLMKLHLFNVHITGDELGCLLFSCYALEWLELEHCDEIVCMKVPCQLQRLNHLKVFECRMLQVIENKAPNICSFDFGGKHVQLLLGESLQMKTLSLQYYCNAVYYARVESIPNVPNLETLTICSYHEMVNTPMLPSKFLHLKCLTIDLAEVSHAYDYFSLVSFLDASPFLETLLLGVR
jgi:hypothetical protein